MFKIEKAETGDLEEVLRVQKRAFMQMADATGIYGIPPLTQTIDELIKEAETTIVLKAVSGGRIVGSARASIEENRVLIKRVVVLPEEQGKGIGKALIGQIEALYNKNPAITEFFLFTDMNDKRSTSFYEKLGYKPFKYQKLNENITFVFMSKQKSRVNA